MLRLALPTSLSSFCSFGLGSGPGATLGSGPPSDWLAGSGANGWLVAPTDTAWSALGSVPRLILAESIPEDLPFAAGSPAAQPLAQAWLQLLDTAQESVHIASYYWSLTGQDVGVNDSSSQQGEALLQKFQQLLLRNISVVVATHSPTLAKTSTDLQVLAAHGRCLRAGLCCVEV